MFSMVMTLGSIMLASAFLITTLQYINPGPVISRDIAKRVEQGFADLKEGYDLYVFAHNGVKPDSMNAITPQYAFIPANLDPDNQWTFGVSGNGRYFCYSGPMNQVQIDALVMLQNHFSPQAYFVNSVCGALSNQVPNPGNATTPAAATYWMALP